MFSTTKAPQTKEDFAELAHAVVTHLGDNWGATNLPYQTGYQTMLLIRDDGLTLDMQLHGYNKKDRIIIGLFGGYGGNPLSRELRSYRNETLPDITVKDDADAKRIANEIKNRLLKDAAEMWVTLLARRAESDAYNDAQAQLMERLVQVSQGAIKPSSINNRDSSTDKFNLSIKNGYGSGSLGRDYVRFDPMSVPSELGLQIAKLLAEYRG